MSKIKFEGNASGTGTLTIAAPNTNTDLTLTLPTEGSLVTADASGNVGIGTSSPGQKLHITNSSSSGYAATRLTTDSRSFDIGLAGSATGWNQNNFYLYDVTAAAERIVVDSSGRVTMPYQPGFRSGTWSFSGDFAINYATSSGNQGGMSFNYRNSGHFNTSNGRFTAPVSGKYLIQATYADDDGVERRQIGHLFINGGNRGEWVESWGQYDNASNCIIEYLNAGDYVEFGRHAGIPYSGLVASVDLLG